MLGVAYTAAVAGGAVSAKLLRIPVAPANIVTALDGHEMAIQMSAGGSPMQIMSREEVREMWAARQGTLTELLADLK